MGLDRLIIKNFKSIGEPGVDLALKPLTLLVGPNGSGKSSILEALAIFAQSIGQDRLQTWGELIKAGPSQDEAIPIEEFIHSKSSSLELTLYKGRLGYQYVYDRASKRAHQLLREADQDLKSNWNGPILSAGWGEQVNRDFATRDRAEEMERTFRECLHEKVFYIAALRGRVEPSAPTTEPPAWTGPQGEDLIQLLNWIDKREHAEVKKHIQEWASQFGIAALEAEWLGGNNLGVSYEDPVLEKPLRVALASHGSRQILTVIVNLLWCQPVSIFLIEEPEISLHPEAQVKVCELFAEVIAHEKQIIATTHSHFLLSALGIPVQEGRLRPEDIAVYHIEKKPDSGTIAERLPVNEKGYIEGWIPSFADVEKRLLREWVKTIPED